MSNQSLWSFMKGMGIIDGAAEEMLDPMREAQSAGKFIYAMESLARRYFVSEREKALRFIFGIDPVPVIIPAHNEAMRVSWARRPESVLIKDSQDIP